MPDVVWIDTEEVRAWIQSGDEPRADEVDVVEELERRAREAFPGVSVLACTPDVKQSRLAAQGHGGLGTKVAEPPYDWFREACEAVLNQ